MRKKILSVLLSVMMILNSLPLQVMAASFGSEPELPVEGNVEQTEEEESSVSTVLAVSSTVVPTVELPSNEELFEGYALKQFYGDVSFFGTAAGEQLNNVEQAIYDYLKTQIEAVAKSGGSTVFTVPDANLTVAGFVNSWTASELGFASVTEITEDVKAAISAKVQAQYNMDKILDALLTDCPFDLYWFEKASYGALQYGYSIGGTTAQLNVTNLTC
ncbi:MAG: hypothetical protein J6A26_03260, partial [Oscillospiraceae bacterium]|nr:hypothetical protein [Oscillospiraceae bacterium]